MSVTRTALDQTSLRDVIAATQAPPIYNSQSLRWRADSTTGVELFADPNRRLSATDPDRRDLILSCGVAPQHLVAALPGAGRAVEVTRMPDSENVHHLAHIDLVATHPEPELAGLAQAIAHRTDRDPVVQLRAGAGATSAILLAATNHGLVTTP